MRVELTESGFADRTATATYGTYIAAETGIEPISSESESDVIPLHYSAIQGRRDLNPYYESQSPVYLPFVRHPTIKWKEKESNLRRAGLQPAALPD